MTPKKLKNSESIRYITVASTQTMRSHVTVFLITVVMVLIGLRLQGYLRITNLTRRVKNAENKISFKKNEENCMKNYFQNYILVIVYNHPHYDSAALLRQFYEPAFPNIFFCGPQTNKSYPNITQVEINRGIFGYHCLAAAYRKYFFYDGYFYINDDVILNYWNLIKDNFNDNLIWQSNNQFGRVSLIENVPQNWYWWVSPYGFENVKQATEEVKKMSEKFKAFKFMHDTFLKNGNGTPYAYNGRSDIAYIPRRYISKFQELSLIFLRHKCFLEIALPTMLRFLAPSSQIQTLKGFYIPGDVRKNDVRVVDSRYFWTTYLLNYRLWFIHPFKLHHYENHNRDLNLLLLNEILIGRTNRYTDC